MFLLYPFSLLMALIVWIRETLYRLNFIRSFHVGTKVLSVGNLTFGGTGKTPIVDFLVTNLKSHKKIAVISRGYGRSTSGFYKVNPEQANAASLYGDEPVQLARNHPDVPFYVCEDRVHGCKQIEKDGKFDLIIADDAFQHLALKRNKDVVVIDATEDLKNYNYPPLGRARNSFSYLKRADYVFLTKTNLCTEDQLNALRKKLEKHTVFEFESRIEGLYDLKSGQKLQTPIRESYLISGIGRPKTFDTLLSKDRPEIHVKDHFIFKDHHAYTDADILEIKEKINGGIALTTEKDAVKLRKFADEMHISVAKLEFINRRTMESFFDEILH